MQLERLISSSAAVSRELEKFELMQIWTADPKISELAEKHAHRMLAEFDTVSIPLHVVLAPDGKELARFTYSPLATPDDYLKFLREGMEKFEKR